MEIIAFLISKGVFTTWDLTIVKKLNIKFWRQFEEDGRFQV